MCGIYGYIDNQGIKYQDRLHLLNKALDTLSHRGPDGRGTWFNDHVFLGHRRLSIIDISDSGSQPMSNSEKNIHIIFNGEIYNYKELSDDLKGIVSQSDTEVILRGYEQKGVDFFLQLRGIYAFCIYDNRCGINKVLLYRDPSGVKPLYYFLGETFVFASEIKAIVASDLKLNIDRDTIQSYLLLGYCMEPSTIYKEVKALEPGFLMTYDYKNKQITKEIFSTYHFNSQNSDGSQTLKFLRKAVSRNMVADVPINFALSGGIDSSLITALAGEYSTNVKALTVSFNDSDYDESKIAALYAKELGIPIRIIAPKIQSNIELLNSLFIHFDQPYADSSAIPFYFLSKSASEYGKVLIGGDGGDEIHNGYPSFNWLPVVWKFREFIPFKILNRFSEVFGKHELKRKLKRLESIASMGCISDAIFMWQCWFSPEKINDMSPFKFSIDSVFKDFFKSFLNDSIQQNTNSVLIEKFFYKRMLSDYLRKADMMSMLNSLEYRVPMLDEDFVQYSLSIKYSLKSKVGKGKRILRELHSNYFPKATSKLKKSGFSIPMDDWLTMEDFEYMQGELMRVDGIVHEYVNKNYILFLFSSLKKRDSAVISRASVYQRILILYNLQHWYLRRIENSLYRQ